MEPHAQSLHETLPAAATPISGQSRIIMRFLAFLSGDIFGVAEQCVERSFGGQYVSAGFAGMEHRSFSTAAADILVRRSTHRLQSLK